jgi:hypothetical protein
MEVRWLFASGELAGLVGWCSGIAIVTMAYIVVDGDLLQRFLTVTCITIWPFRHDWNCYDWIVWPLKMEALRDFELTAAIRRRLWEICIKYRGFAFCERNSLLRE